jgi:hypothetical protein
MWSVPPGGKNKRIDLVIPGPMTNYKSSAGMDWMDRCSADAIVLQLRIRFAKKLDLPFQSGGANIAVKWCGTADKLSGIFRLRHEERRIKARDAAELFVVLPVFLLAITASQETVSVSEW